MKRTNLEQQWKETEKRVTDLGGAGADFVLAIREMRLLYDERLPSWLGSLYDKDIGGFYYSVSARDNRSVVHKDKEYNLLPDIESTLQALNILKNTGMISDYSELPEAMRQGIREFTESLLSPNDGYIYHPQWGKDINSARRGRDLMWATNIAAKLGFDLPYPTAYERMKNKPKNDECVTTVPEHLRSEEAFRKYLSEMDFKISPQPYINGNTLAAQSNEIVAAGLGGVAVEFLNSVQNPETGFWGVTCKTPYDYVNGILKISTVYSTAGAMIPNACRSAMSVIDCMTYPLTPETPCFTACWQYNCWSALLTLVDNLERYGENGEKEISAIRKKLIKRAPEAIIATKEKLSVFKKDDGGFSMLPGNSAYTSQCQPVAMPLTPEGDVNATVLCTSGLYSRMWAAFGIGIPEISIYSGENYEDFLSSLSL